MIYNDKHRAMGILSSKKPQKNNLLFTPSQTNPIHQQSINIIETEEEKKKRKQRRRRIKRRNREFKKEKRNKFIRKITSI